MDSARHVIGYHLTEENEDTRVQSAYDDGASTIHESLAGGAGGGRGHGGEPGRGRRQQQRVRGRD